MIMKDDKDNERNLHKTRTDLKLHRKKRGINNNAVYKPNLKQKHKPKSKVIKNNINDTI